MPSPGLYWGIEYDRICETPGIPAGAEITEGFFGLSKDRIPSQDATGQPNSSHDAPELEWFSHSPLAQGFPEGTPAANHPLAQHESLCGLNRQPAGVAGVPTSSLVTFGAQDT